MSRVTGRRLLAGIAIALLVGQAGCARPVRVPKLGGAQLGTIGVVAGRFTPALTYKAPPKGGAAASREGAAQGFRGALGSGNIFLMLGAPLAAGLTAIEGAATAQSAEEVESAELALKTAFAELQLHGALRDQAGRLLEARMGRPAVILVDHGPDTADGFPDYSTLAAQGIQTVLELRVPAVGLRSLGRPVGNPGLQFAMLVRVRAVDAVTGRELFRGELPRLGAVLKFGEWGASDGQRFREEARRATESAAWVIVDALFCAGAACPGR